MKRKKKKYMILDKVNGEQRCGYCGRKIYTHLIYSPLLYTVDHITPISKGGTNKKRNLIASCAECNSAKRDLYIDQFRKLLGGHFKFYFEEIRDRKKERKKYEKRFV